MSKRRKNKPKKASRSKSTPAQPTAKKAKAPEVKKPTPRQAAAKAPTAKTTRAAAVPRRPKSDKPLVFGRDTYIWLAGAFGLIVLGLLLMSGGGQPDPNVWDEDIIYSWRRITLAPLVMLAGVGMAIYAVLKK
ncbi:MAG: DUF3098 domain-containing protein [Bacteroidota bacterium]